MLKFERLTDVSHPRYGDALKLYQASFPYHEQRTEQFQRLVVENAADYRFTLIYDGTEWVGECLYWEGPGFRYVEHFCTRPELRGRSYGAQALAKLREAGIPVILEIDPPVDDISRRRRGFYERCGFVENPFPHVHPTYHDGIPGHDLVVMSCPAELTQEEYAAFAAYLRGVVMAEKWTK